MSSAPISASSLTFERTRDWDLIKEIVTHKSIYPFVSDDFAPRAEEWQPLQHDAAWYVLAKDGKEILGIWALFPLNHICWWVHTCLLPQARGPRARQAAREAMHWLFSNSGCLRIITEVPMSNTLALAFAIRAGMRRFGVNPKSFMKHGQLEDVILLGISRDEVIPCP